jgi:hypothetical protein
MDGITILIWSVITLVLAFKAGFWLGRFIGYTESRSR